MAYPQQARYAQPNDYYDAPRSAPLNSPREYADDGYGESQYQQGYYDDSYANGYNQPKGNHPPQQYRQQPPPARHPQQGYPQQRGPAGVQMRGRGGGYTDRGPNNDQRYGQPQGPYQNGPPRGAPQGGGGRPPVQNGYSQQQQYEEYNGHRQQNHGRAYQQQPQGPPDTIQAPPRPRPTPQRSYSAEAPHEAFQQDSRAQNTVRYDQQQGTLDGRGVKPVPLDPALPKKEKDKIFNNQPTSPDSLAWDNPFPSFPKKAANLDAPRPETAISRRSEESTRPREQDTMARGTSDNMGGQRRPYQPEPGMQPINESQRSYEQGSQRARPPPPQRAHGQPAMSPPQPAFAHDTQRSNTMPNDVSENMMQANLPVRPRDYAQAQVALQQHNSPQPQQAYGLPRNPQPVKGQYRSNSLSHDQSYEEAYSRPQPSLHNNSGYSQGSYSDVADSYHDGSRHTRPISFNDHAAAHHADTEEDMPNFEAATTSAEPEKVLHIEPKNSASSTSVDQDRRGRAAYRGLDGDFAGQAQRSRSQPNTRNQSNDAHGFDFGLEGQASAIPPIDPRYAQGGYENRPRQGSGQAAYRGSPSNPQYSPESWQQQGAEGFGPPPRARTDNLNQGPGYRQRPPTGDPYMRGPSAGFSPSQGAGSRNGTPVGAPSPMGSSGLGNAPSPLNTSRAVSEGSNRQRGQPMSPTSMNAPSPPTVGRPTNPDALPQHPVPVRPGLMGQTQSPPMNSQPTARPPPIRQYNSGSSAGPSPQPTAVRQIPVPQSGEAPVTNEELQRLRGIVQQNPNEQATQLVLAKKMVEAAAVLADEGGRADPKTKARNRERYIFDAHKMVKKLVGQGNKEAMFYLADCHGSGLLGLQKDPKEAFQLYQSAAKLNHPQAAYRVAVCCEMGQDEGGGTRRDPLKAVQWYKRSATLGDVPAMYKIGVIQLKGLLGQPKEPREAVTWLKRAAERADADNPHALHELGILFLNAGPNDSILRDEPYSAQLFTQAANLGYKFSQYRLGAAYEYGHMGFAIDPRASITWYSKAAMQEEHQSELALSGWYLTGSEGILAQSDTEAYLWARKAAQAGLAKAEYAMGYFTEVGIGAPADLEAAKRWYWKSASQNFPKARERLEDLRRGGAKMQKTRVSRTAVNNGQGECRVM